MMSCYLMVVIIMVTFMAVFAVKAQYYTNCASALFSYSISHWNLPVSILSFPREKTHSSGNKPFVMSQTTH